RGTAEILGHSQTKGRANRGNKLRPNPARQSSTLPMSGVWKQSHGRASEAPPNERGRQQICSAYSHCATSRLYPLPPFVSLSVFGPLRTLSRRLGSGYDPFPGALAECFLTQPGLLSPSITR